MSLERSYDSNKSYDFFMDIYKNLNTSQLEEFIKNYKEKYEFDSTQVFDYIKKINVEDFLYTYKGRSKEVYINNVLVALYILKKRGIELDAFAKIRSSPNDTEKVFAGTSFQTFKNTSRGFASGPLSEIMNNFISSSVCLRYEARSDASLVDDIIGAKISSGLMANLLENILLIPVDKSVIETIRQCKS
jgi:hypothetical protein